MINSIMCPSDVRLEAFFLNSAVYGDSNHIRVLHASANDYYVVNNKLG